MLGWLAKLFRKGRKSPAQKGAYWEKVAVRNLKASGMKIVARNWKRPGAHGELDIVALDGGALVFVEVRSRGVAALVGGFHSISHHKRAVLRDACNDYLSRLRVKPLTYRFDVVEISYSSERDYEMRHYKGVPLFG
jgi:putative endonuclease